MAGIDVSVYSLLDMNAELDRNSVELHRHRGPLSWGSLSRHDDIEISSEDRRANSGLVQSEVNFPFSLVYSEVRGKQPRHCAVPREYTPRLTYIWQFLYCIAATTI